MTRTVQIRYDILKLLRAYAAFLVIYEHLFGSYIDLVLKQYNFYSYNISKFIFHPIGILISKIGYNDEKMIFIFLVMLVLIFAISAFSYKFIEKPCQVLARRLLCRLKNE